MKSTKRIRSVLLTVWLAPYERDVIRRTAELSGMTVSEYVRKRVLGAEMPVIESRKS